MHSFGPSTGAQATTWDYIPVEKQTIPSLAAFNYHKLLSSYSLANPAGMLPDFLLGFCDFMVVMITCPQDTKKLNISGLHSQ